MTDKSKKKILYIITKSVWGGAGKYVYDLATGLPQTKFRSMVAAGGQGELAQKIKEAGIPYFEIKNFQYDINIIKEILAYFEILLLLFKIRPDIIHINSSKAGGIVGVAAWDYCFLTFNFKLKIIFTAHGWAFHENRHWWHILLIKLFTKLTCFYYSKIICVSEYDRLSAIKNHIAPKRKLITIHNGIAVENYKFLSKKTARQKLWGCIQIPRPRKLYTDAIIMGAIGEYTKNKGHEYLIEAVAKLSRLAGSRRPLEYNKVAEKIVNCKLKIFIIGWGENKANLKSQISNLKLENEIFLINNLPNAASYFKAFDIFVLPSIKEGLPYTLLEAGLAELPVVSTKAGGIPEIIGHDEGVLVEPANADDLAEKIEEMINGSEKRKLMGISLRQKILREFPFEKMLNATLAAYE